MSSSGVCPPTALADVLASGWGAVGVKPTHPRGGLAMAVVVVIHHLKNFDEWAKQFKANPPPKVGRWRMFRGADDRNRAHVVGEVAASDVKAVKDFLDSPHMQMVFKAVNAMSTAPVEIVWLDEQPH